jgi:glycosyltransferase involved in cell wall biosynthesis
MSVRNGLPYIQQTVQSIISQTFRDWEFIIVDNASSDGTIELLEAMALSEPRIKLIRNEVDLGHSGGLNKGLENCRGAWIARIDADDVAVPNRLERQLDFLRNNPDVQVTSCLGYYINGDGKIVANIVHDLTTREAFQNYMSHDLAIGILHPGALMSRELVEKVGGYRSAFDPANDTDLWGRMADTGAVILVQPEPLMKYRVHDGSISAHSFSQNRLKYQWARDCMRARRYGNPEPTWEEYVAARKRAPLWKKANRWRKTRARQLYRQSAQNFISRRVFSAGWRMLLATLLQPSYALVRLFGQLPISPCWLNPPMRAIPSRSISTGITGIDAGAPKRP